MVSPLVHHTPRDRSSRAETYFNQFIERRWKYWRPVSTLWANRENIPLKLLQKIHTDRCQTLRRMLMPKLVIRRNELDCPLQDELLWKQKVDQHLNLRIIAQASPGHRFRRGHSYHPKKEKA